MNSARHLAREILSNLERQHSPMLIFHVFFSVLAAVMLLPATSWIMAIMLTQGGDRAFSNREVIDFVLSPAGLLWGLTGGTLVLCLVTLQRAGMIVIAAEHRGGPYRQAVTAIVHVARKLPRLFRLALVRAVAHIVLAAPFLLVIYGLHDAILGDYDNVMRLKPPAFWIFLAAALPFAGMIVFLNGSLHIRWLLALPCIMLEHASVRGALRRSHRLTRGWRLRLAMKALAIALMILLLPAVLVFVFDNLAALLLGALPDVFGLLIPATIAVLTLYILFAFMLTFLAISVSSLFVFSAHRRATGRSAEPLPARQPRRAGLFSWSIELLLTVFALWQASHVLDRFRFVDDVVVVAHRGSSIEAPENTLAALELAIREGADYLEIDVRENADGTPVLLHDRNLRRVAGVPRPIRDISDEELSRIDVGSRVGEAFAGETIPSLAEAVALACGSAMLFIDIKTGPQTRGLVRRTLETLRACGMPGNAIIGAAHPAVLREVQRLAPGVTTALFVHFSIGVASPEFDILGLRSSVVTPESVLRAHRNGHEIFVFTVNGRAEMSRLIDMGVDGIITDRPAVLNELLADRAALSEGELLVVKLRHWLRN